MTEYNQIEIAQKIVEELLQKMGVDAKVEYEESITKGLIFNISSYDSYLLIGRQGVTLHALQILAQALVSKKLAGMQLQSSPPKIGGVLPPEREGGGITGQALWFSLDVDDYKRKREWFLKETASAAVSQLKKTGRPLSLEPMPNYERRLIHAYLQEHHPETESSSIGDDPYRKVIIRLKR